MVSLVADLINFIAKIAKGEVKPDSDTLVPGGTVIRKYVVIHKYFDANKHFNPDREYRIITYKGFVFVTTESYYLLDFCDLQEPLVIPTLREKIKAILK